MLQNQPSPVDTALWKYLADTSVLESHHLHITIWDGTKYSTELYL